MSYQALARKWRPKTFSELVGQEHVVTALTNALTRNRLHHAYLLTGTRGVGKTTIARILAKSLNCITHGITAAPCGTCAACADIDAGRFVDLLELDAASNTGIDNMREVLDNARYMPTVGRFKVYLIDEVHMLSKAAFNSMLKTLEEPPEHVKFVLATTDPQKIPVTVLSRCLQFNLKQLSPALIADRMTAILTAEGVASDAPALALIARAAHGSMRDALSLLDQAIAYGGGDVRDAVVRTMLGAVDTEYVYRIVDALIAGDGPALLAEVDAMALRSIAFASALEDLASLFHRIAVAQTVPQAATAMDDAERVAALAARLAPETVQLAYQICVQGRADLPLAPDEATGFSMTLLRLLAFEPGGVPVSGGMKEAPPRRAAGLDVTAGAGALTTDAAGPKPPSTAPGRAATATATPVIVPMSAPVSAPTAAPQGSDPPVRTPMPTDPAAWPAFVAVLRLAPMAAQLAAQTELKSIEGNVLTLALPAAHKHLADRAYADKLKAALDQSTGRKWILAFEVGSAAEASLAAQRSREQAEQKARTEAAFRDEPFVQDALARFDAKIRPDSIKPVS
ncbi:MAG: DNA polymerase III subunit gamma/tau [Betaproteobacteria bacterium]|nr:DNA polymerase III subunit gamma/tau [Betaproteobacteria bacterium]